MTTLPRGTDQVLQRDSANAIALELRGTLHYWSSLFGPLSEVEAAAALRRDGSPAAVSIETRLARAGARWRHCRFFAALKSLDQTARLVMLTLESHSYAARESMLQHAPTIEGQKR